MTIVTSLDHKPTYRERLEFEVMMALEEAVNSEDQINCGVLAGRIMDVLDALDPTSDAAFVDAGATGTEKSHRPV